MIVQLLNNLEIFHVGEKMKLKKVTEGYTMRFFKVFVIVFHVGYLSACVMSFKPVDVYAISGFDKYSKSSSPQAAEIVTYGGGSICWRSARDVYGW